MTEPEWLACDDTQPMLDFLRGKASDRKLRLFAVACCRQIWRLLQYQESQHAVETSELYADGMATAKQLRAAQRRADAVASEVAFEAPLMLRRTKWAEKDAAYAAAAVARKRPVPNSVSALARAAVTFTSWKSKNQSALLRDIIGPLPFRPVAIDPAWLRWNNGTVPA